MRNLLIALCVGTTVLACAPKSREAEKDLINIDELIDRQLERLNRGRPTLNKVAGVNESVSDTTWVPSAAEWKSALEIFRSLGTLNQRIYAGSYAVVGPLDDPRSNLLIRQYSSESAPLRRLLIYYQDDPGRIRQVEGEIEETTLLYSAYRRLSLWFDDEHGLEPLMSRYEIDGYQKTSLRDTVRFRVVAGVRW